MLKNTDNVVKAVRYAVRTRDFWVTFVADNNVTRDMIPAVAKEIAVLAYPNDEQVQKTDGKRTRFGNAVQAAASMLRKVIETDSTTPETDYLAAVIKASDKAIDHEIDAAAVLAAVTAWAESVLS